MKDVKKTEQEQEQEHGMKNRNANRPKAEKFLYTR